MSQILQETLKARLSFTVYCHVAMCLPVNPGVNLFTSKGSSNNYDDYRLTLLMDCFGLRGTHYEFRGKIISGNTIETNI